MKYSDSLKNIVLALLHETPLPRDALPYTPEFEKLKARIAAQTHAEWDDAQFWQALSNIGKGEAIAGGTRRKRAPRTPSLSTEEQLELLRLFPDGIGNPDQLPYTPRFEELHRRFSKRTETKLSKHEFWRALSRVAKRSRKPKPVFDSAPLGGLSAELVGYLERTNPWWRGDPAGRIEPVRRWAFAEAFERLKSGITPVVAIRGPRQVGKTTIQEQLIEELLLIHHVPPGRILRVQFDEVPALGRLLHPVDTIVRWYEAHVLGRSINAAAKRGEDVYLLFDELQNLSKWSAQLKALADHVSARILVTGSSALRIVRERDSLAGRLSIIELGPLRLYEIARIRHLGILSPFAPNVQLAEWTRRDFWEDLLAHAKKHRRVLNRAFSAFSRVGGYPRCHNAMIKDIGPLARHVVETVVDRTIEHDPVDAPGRKGPDRRIVREVFRLVCRYAGQHVTSRRIAQEITQVLPFGVTEKSVDESVQFLVDSMLLHAVPPLELLLKKQPNPSKLCICDHFVRNAWLQETVPLAPDALATAQEATTTVAGHIIESVIGYYLMGIPGLEVAWFPKRPGEAEIDFVLTIGTKRIPIEVKYRRGPVAPDDYAALQAFCAKKHYEAPFGLLITQRKSGRIDDNVFAVPASDLILIR